MRRLPIFFLCNCALSQAETQTWYESSFRVINCSRMVMRSVTLHGSGAFAFGEFGGEGAHVYDGVKVVRREGGDHLLASNVRAILAAPLSCRVGG